MSLLPRRSLGPVVLLSVAFMVLGLAMAGAVEARVLVVRADGTGDVPTFQAGVDALLTDPSEFETDTLRVEAGIYGEDVSMESTRGFDAVIHCVAGPEQTELRSLRGFSIPIENGIGRITIHGLRVRGRVGLGVELPRPFLIPRLLLENCRFMGDVDIPRAYGFSGSGIIDCEFRSRLALGAAGYRVARCRFTGQAARLALWTDFFLNAEECVFSGADTAVVTVSNQTDAVSFDRCRFTNVGTGIAVSLDANGSSQSNYQGVFVKDCRFENISGAAILVTPMGPPRDLVRRISINVRGTRFFNCFSAVDGRQSAPLALSMEADTLIACRGPGIDATVSAASMKGLVVSGSSGDGARLRLQDGNEVTLEECQFLANRGDGLRLVDDRGGSDSEVSLRMNSSLANGGAGIRLSRGAAADPTAIVIANNLLAGNAGGGLLIEKAYAGQVANNDAWLNGGRAFEGLAGEPNLELDPQFCEPSGEDARVAASSPCAPLGPFGQIGASGVGCDRMGVAVDALPRTHRAIRTQSGAPVGVAILGRPLFDARRVDATSVRANGVAAAPRGNGMNATRLDDVNRDGRIDLLMTFDSRTLPPLGDRLVLEGWTLDGAHFQGSDGVKFIPGAIDTSYAAHEPSPLTLVVPSPQRAHEFEVKAAAAEGAARIEMFDVTGRRILSRDLAPETGGQAIHFGSAGDLRSGIYMVRMSQHGASVTRRVVLTQ